MFADVVEARRSLAEIGSVQKQLADRQQKLDEKDASVKSAVTDAQNELSKILKKKTEIAGEAAGLQDAFSDMASALRVVETGDRTAPSQAIAVYDHSIQDVQAGIAKWNTFKTTKLPELNQKLSQLSLAPISAAK